MNILGCGWNRTLAHLLDSETSLGRKCPRVSVAICSIAPTSFLLASWTNPALTQREIRHFLHHQNSFLQQIGVPWRSPMKLLIQIGQTEKGIVARHPAVCRERVGSGEREIRGQPIYISQLPASSHIFRVFPCLESNSQAFPPHPGVLLCLFHSANFTPPYLGMFVLSLKSLTYVDSESQQGPRGPLEIPSLPFSS